MNLNYELPAWAEEILPPAAEEKRYYSVPYDIGADGAWLSDSYVVVTNKKIYLLTKGSPAECFALTDCEEAAAEAKVGCGLLTVRYRGEKRFLVQYSGKYLARYAYIARGIRILCSGRTEKVESTEYEKICPNCGRAVPGTRYCPHCSKEGGFWHSFLTMAAPYRRKFLGIIVLMILAAVVTLLNPEVQKRLVDDVLTQHHGGIRMALVCLFIMFLLSVGIVVINVLKSYYS